MIVSNYNKVLIPEVDYAIQGDRIVFTEAPRAKDPSDDTTTTFITYFIGFTENQIVRIDNLAPSFGEGKKVFSLTRGGVSYEPIVDEYVVAVYDGRLLTPKVDYFLDGDRIVFDFVPIVGRSISLYVIEAPIPSFGSGAKGYARIDDDGQLTKISSANLGTGYRFEYPLKFLLTLRMVLVLQQQH